MQTEDSSILEEEKMGAVLVLLFSWVKKISLCCLNFWEVNFNSKYLFLPASLKVNETEFYYYSLKLYCNLSAEKMVRGDVLAVKTATAASLYFILVIFFCSNAIFFPVLVISISIKFRSFYSLVDLVVLFSQQPHTQQVSVNVIYYCFKSRVKLLISILNYAW